jgi:hypothetical protein
MTMKKTMMILALLLMVVTLSAQTGVKISAKYKKGDNMLYRQTATINVGGKDIHVKSDCRYVVTAASSKGFTIDSNIEKVESDGDPNDIMGRMMNITMEILKDVKCTYVTDADGKIIDCLTVSHQESKGYGDACATEEYYDQFRGSSASDITITVTHPDYMADQISPDNTDKGVIASATYTTAGYQKAVKAAFAAFEILTANGGEE